MKRKRTVAKSARRPSLLMLVLVIASIATLAMVADEWRRDAVGVTLRISGSRVVSDAEIRTSVDIADTARLAELDLLAIQQRIEAIPFVKQAIVRREPPTTLAIEIIERTPLVLLLNTGAKDWYLDDEGCILPAEPGSAPRDLPVLTGFIAGRSLVPGMKIRAAQVQRALHVLNVDGSIGGRSVDLFSEVDLSQPNDLILYTLEAGVPVIFGDSTLAERKLRSFRTFWENVAVKSRIADLEYVDLRFRDQVVVRWRDRADTTAVAPRDTLTAILD